MNMPDRSRCLLNFNEYANYSESILFDNISVNGTQVSCNIQFDDDLKVESDIYFIYFAGT